MSKFYLSVLMAASLFTGKASAQLSTNPDKFLGNITTSYQVDYGNEKYYTLWNQITPENESKWGSVEGSRGNFNWGCDKPFNYAKNHGFTYKFHALVWGYQYPGWFTSSMSVNDRYNAIVKWFDAVKKKYPTLPMIDVVNEAVGMHQQGNPLMKESLGGGGKTGYDWLIKAFEMAHERWPDAILIYNDYNTFQWDTDAYIDLVRTLRDAGAPIDAYGCQSHDLTDCDLNKFKSSMNKIQTALKMPMYITEYDIGTENDNLQLQRYKEQLPVMWEADYCAGVTLWGYIYGHTWTTDGNSGLIKDGKDRPAMTWLREYMKTDAAKNAKSPFPGMKKEASVYIKPQTLSASKGEPMTITVNARLATKTIDHIDLFVKGTLYQSLTEASSVNSKTKDAAYVAEYTPATTGKYALKAIVYATDGSTYQREGSFTAYNPRSPYKNVIAELPGTIEAENFDVGGDGVTYHDSNSNREGDAASYRSDGGIDVVKGNNGYALGYTAEGEWTEYTVNVTKAGTYAYDAYVSSGVTGAAINMSIETPEGTVSNLSENIAIPQTGNSSWNNYVAVHGRTLISLAEGKHILRLNITGSNGNIDKLVFKHLDINQNLRLSIKATPAPATADENTTLIATTTAQNLESVSFYVNNQLVKTITEAPYEANYKPTAKGTYNVTAEATDTDGKTSKVFTYTLKVNNKRTPYKSVINLPGVIQAENFDKGGEGVTFHDSDSEDQGDAKSRSDNEGVDLVKGNNGTVIGYTAAGEWLEYSVKVTEPGTYSYEATVSSGVSGSGFTLGLVEDGKVTSLCKVNVPQTGSNSWDTYKVVKGNITRELTEGEHIFRITINGANCNIDKMELKLVQSSGIEDVNSMPQPADGSLYNLAGQKVDKNYRGIVIKNGKKYWNQ